ncbi:hypothetical protein [Candidatus Methylobacter oryzae]|uniref:Uncharacterized protein n=1 Tax=Candidatus Methylobacter oryzae TaxID=2497749 RepID=A0ABY3C6Q9_9GAMM|nr:hypothetical protein [Candidatus Methylobacter oryzae]TRW90668.1 hypothetical protein EKO24_018815 [Candidatus Methylobacter oryzae]
MTADYITEEQEDEYKGEVQDSLLREVAVHMLHGMTEKSAIQHVTEVAHRRQKAEQSDNVIKDEDGFVENYLESELEPPNENGLNKSQINAIYQKLTNKGIEIVN